jgi:hypothetical protein
MNLWPGTVLLAGVAWTLLRQSSLLWRQLQAIANAEFSEDMSWSRRVGFELSPQRTDENPKILDLVSVGRTPNLAEQLSVRQDLTGMGDQMAKQLELLGRQLDLVAGAGAATR